MGNIHRAITVPVNEVYMKASSELMKNSDFGIPVEQLDSLIWEWTRRAQGSARVIGLRETLLQLAPSSFLPGLITVLGEVEQGRLWAAILAWPQQEERNQFARPWAPIFPGLCSECSRWQAMKSFFGVF